MSIETKITFLSGKMGAGKTTYAKELAQSTDSIYLSEDDMLSQFFPNEIKNITDYVIYSNRIKPFVVSFLKQLSNTGVDVVLDFPGNTKRQRSWFKEIIESLDVTHELVYLKASDTLCLKQIKKRRELHPERHQFDTEDTFHQVTSYFQEPESNEGFNLLILVRNDDQ